MFSSELTILLAHIDSGLLLTTIGSSIENEILTHEIESLKKELEVLKSNKNTNYLIILKNENLYHNSRNLVIDNKDISFVSENIEYTFPLKLVSIIYESNFQEFLWVDKNHNIKNHFSFDLNYFSFV